MIRSNKFWMESEISRRCSRRHRSHHKPPLLVLLSTITLSPGNKLKGASVRLVFMKFWAICLQGLSFESSMPLESHSFEAKCLVAAFHMASWWQFLVSRYRSFLARARSSVSWNICSLYGYDENLKVSLFFSESSLICQLKHMFIIQIRRKCFGGTRDATCPHTATSRHQ
jgi:hypothetical protein